MPPPLPEPAADNQRFCYRCGTALAATMLACPNCRELVYATELQDLVNAAKQAESEGERDRARELWSSAMTLLPPETVQYRTIQAHLQTEPAGQTAAEAPRQPAPAGGHWRKYGGSAAVGAALLWKFKAVPLLLLSKAKVLLFGFSKMGTLLSMFASFGLYLTMFGWKFALGLVLSIYVHEMGHIAAYRQFGLPVSAPMFVPGFGAFVRGHYLAATAPQRARISLAGPLWGLGAALACFAMAALTGSPLWAAMATVGAQINLLNLIPIWIFDGAGAVEILDRPQRLLLAALACAAWIITREGFLFLVLIGLLYHAFRRARPAGPGDWQIATQYAGLLAVLGIMTLVPVEVSTIQ